MKNRISTLVGLRNNVEDSKQFYKYFRNIYPEEELVFVSYGSTDTTHTWLDSLIDRNLKYFYSEETKTLSDTYNKCAELSTNLYIVFCHNDMVISPMFLENLEKYNHKDRAIGYVTVEPPIFPSPRIGKIIKDFGSGFENFDESFFNFSREEQQNSKDKTEEGITFFMSLSREVFLEIGGFDNIFNPFMSEDDDLIRRLKLYGLKCFTSRDSLTFHFVSKTSRFSEEYKLKTQQIEQNSNRIYLKKWGSYNSNNRFNIGLVIDNPNQQLLTNLEPWVDKIYIDDSECSEDIIIRFDGQKFNNNSFEIIQNLQNILGEITEPGIYEIDIFTINAVTLNNRINSLIFIQK